MDFSKYLNHLVSININYIFNIIIIYYELSQNILYISVFTFQNKLYTKLNNII